MISCILKNNDIKHLQKVLKHIESALSNGGSIIFIAIGGRIPLELFFFSLKHMNVKILFLERFW